MKDRTILTGGVMKDRKILSSNVKKNRKIVYLLCSSGVKANPLLLCVQLMSFVIVLNREIVVSQ